MSRSPDRGRLRRRPGVNEAREIVRNPGGQAAGLPVLRASHGGSEDRWPAHGASTVGTAISAAVTVGRAAGGGTGMPVAEPRRIAERVHDGQLDANGEPYIAHVGRVAAGVPAFARAVGWLHDVAEGSGVEESELVAAGANLDECAALRVLTRGEAEYSDELYLEHVRVIALSAGVSGRIARAVKRADLPDEVSHRGWQSARWLPPYGEGLVLLFVARTSSAATGARCS